MWMWTPPSSTIRRASAAYSAGVYGMAGHWSRLASAPEMAQVMTTGSSRLKVRSVESGTCHFPLFRITVALARRGGGYYANRPPSTRKELHVIGAIILGIVAGFIARALMPGRDPMGFFATILLGLAGAVVGFLIFTELLNIGDDKMFDLGGLIGAIIGVMILLGLYRAYLGRRGGPARA